MLTLSKNTTIARKIPILQCLIKLEKHVLKKLGTTVLERTVQKKID